MDDVVMEDVDNFER
jgi:hypothetical protein